MNRTRAILLMACWVSAGSIAFAQTSDRKVAGGTRLDWEFACASFGKGAAKLPAGYDSAKQKYQLYIPKTYKKDKPAPLVLFISPGDGPQGLKAWQKVCDQEGALFASPYDAGNSTPAGPRTRIILDVLDDVRRLHAVDPDRTYITGFSGGGRMACAIGFALPEYFGAVVPICGTNTIGSQTYLRHRIEERLSVAFVTGETDSNRKENEEVMYPWFKEIDIRTKLWLAPKLGHAIPPESVLSEVHTWIAEDLERRRTDRKSRPKLAVAADDTPNGKEQAKRLVETAQDDLKDAARTWRGVALLQGVSQRWGGTPESKQAQRLLKDVLGNETLLQRIDEQGTADEVKSISAQAKAMERFGFVPKAIEAWEILAKNYEGTPVGAKAIENIKRLRAKGK